MKSLVYRENFLSLTEIKFLTSYLNLTNRWENNGDGIWNNRCINLSTMEEHVRETMLDIRIRARTLIEQKLNLKKQLYFDIFQFVRWREGDELYPPHADAEHLDGSPHPFPYRDYACIIYLNTEFAGGNTYFTNFDNYSPTIKPGTLISFPGTLEYCHGVSKVTSGLRYTIAGFLTFDKDRADGYRI